MRPLPPAQGWAVPRPLPPAPPPTPTRCPRDAEPCERTPGWGGPAASSNDWPAARPRRRHRRRLSCAAAPSSDSPSRPTDRRRRPRRTRSSPSTAGTAFNSRRVLVTLVVKFKNCQCCGIRMLLVLADPDPDVFCFLLWYHGAFLQSEVGWPLLNVTKRFQVPTLHQSTLVTS